MNPKKMVLTVEGVDMCTYARVLTCVPTPPHGAVIVRRCHYAFMFNPTGPKCYSELMQDLVLKCIFTAGHFITVNRGFALISCAYMRACMHACMRSKYHCMVMHYRIYPHRMCTS